MTKKEQPETAPAQHQAAPVASQQQDSPLAIISMVLGVTSLTGPGFLFGIPAIITAIIALKRQENGRGLSITGLVTGIVSTVVSLLLLAIFIIGIVWAINHPAELRQQAPREAPEMRFESSQT